MAGGIDFSRQDIGALFQVEKYLPAPAQVAKKEPSERKKEAAPDTREKNAEFLREAQSNGIDQNREYSVSEESGQIVVKVTNSETGEVIRVIPFEEIQKSKETFAGLLVDEES